MLPLREEFILTVRLSLPVSYSPTGGEKKKQNKQKTSSFWKST